VTVSPGAELWKYIQDRFRTQSLGLSQFEFDTTASYLGIIRAANAAGVSMYMVDASGLSIDTGVSAENRAMEARIDPFIEKTNLQSMPQLMAEGHLDAVAVTASSYTTGEHVTFYDSAQHIAPWARSQRLSVRDPLDLDHLLASSAIPFVFPAVKLSVQGRDHYCGDGSMRQAAPISPAIHLGADRILVIGVGRLYEPPDLREKVVEYPNLAQIAGHANPTVTLGHYTQAVRDVSAAVEALELAFAG